MRSDESNSTWSAARLALQGWLIASREHERALWMARDAMARMRSHEALARVHMEQVGSFELCRLNGDGRLWEVHLDSAGLFAVPRAE